MKKYIPYIIITILLVIIASGTTYIFMDKKDNKPEIKENNNNKPNDDKVNNNESETKQDGVKLLKTYNLNNKIIEEFEVTLNGKTKTIKATFNYNQNDEELDNVKGSLNDISLYSKYYFESENKEKGFSVKVIKEAFNENNFQIIKGIDNKSYLLIKADYEEELELLVLNDNFELLSKNIREDNRGGRTGFNITYFYNHICEIEKGNPWYKDTFGINDPYNHIHIKVEDNKIYFLAPILNENYDGNDYGILEERVDTINNDKLNYNVISTYKITEVCQQI